MKNLLYFKKCFTSIGGWVFPYVRGTKAPPPEKIMTIEQLNKNVDLSMDIAIRLHDAEIQRRQSADTKAGLYLAFLAAILPVVSALSPTISDVFQHDVLVLNAAVLAVALIYFLMAAWYAAKAIRPSTIYAISERDLFVSLNNACAKAIMASELIEATRRNYPINNEKITYVRLTQAHIFRAFLAITLLVAMDVGSAVGVAVLAPDAKAEKSPGSEIACTPWDIKSNNYTNMAQRSLSYSPMDASYLLNCASLLVDDR